jgi:hypothetical protein
LKIKLICMVWIILAASLAGCSEADGPEAIVERYLQAVVANDEIRAVDLSCAAWESQARAEGRSFEGVEVSLEDVSCQASEMDGQHARVQCAGQIVYSYGGGENKQLDLATRTFALVLEGAVWRMCGYE